VGDEPQKLFTSQRMSVVNRGQACALAQSQPRRAFDRALTIPDGRYRCQAMADIGLHAPDDLSEQAFRQARAAAGGHRAAADKTFTGGVRML